MADIPATWNFIKDLKIEEWLELRLKLHDMLACYDLPQHNKRLQHHSVSVIVAQHDNIAFPNTSELQ